MGETRKRKGPKEANSDGKALISQPAPVVEDQKGQQKTDILRQQQLIADQMDELQTHDSLPNEFFAKFSLCDVLVFEKVFNVSRQNVYVF